jgi:hypothetical protein
MNDTVENNILFNKEFDPILYDEVLNTCQLLKDLEILKEDIEFKKEKVKHLDSDILNKEK